MREEEIYDIYEKNDETLELRNCKRKKNKG